MLCCAVLCCGVQVRGEDFSSYLSKLSTPRELLIMMTEMFARIEAHPEGGLTAQVCLVDHAVVPTGTTSRSLGVLHTGRGPLPVHCQIPPR